MIWRRLLAAAAFAGLAASQVTTDCNPLNETCPANPALGTKESFTFNKTQNGQLWETVVGPIEYDPETGAKFTINEQGDSPTLRTKFYFFFGRVEFVLKAASGKGIVSSMMLLSDDLDEIDWEFIGSDNRASSNFFGKGIEDYTFGEYHDMDVAPQDDYHNYTTIWTEEKLEWYIDDALVRSLKKDEAKVNDTDVYPQTPCRMSLGIWAGGDPSLNEWTRKWAGGDTDYDAGPYDMYVKSAYIEDYGEGKEYKWGDNSGSWESIEIVEGNSTAYDAIHNPPQPEKSLNEKFNDLPQAGKIAIYAGGAAVAGLIIGAGIFYCIKQRRRGAAEARMALQRSEAERMEMNRFDKAGVNPDGFTEQATEYNPHAMKTGGMAGANYYNVPNDSTSSFGTNEKGWEGAAAGAGAAGGAAALRNQTQSPRVNSPAPGSFYDAHSTQSPVTGGFPSPPPPGPMRTPSPGMTRSQSPMIRSPGSPGPQQAYGAHRMQQDGTPMSPGARSFSDNQGYGVNRMQSPGPSPMSPSARSFSDNQGFGGPSQGYGYRQ